jgi:hypothetical protein
LFLIFSGFLEEGERGESQEKGGREGVRQGLKPFLFCVLREGGKKNLFSPLFHVYSPNLVTAVGKDDGDRGEDL